MQNKRSTIPLRISKICLVVAKKVPYFLVFRCFQLKESTSTFAGERPGQAAIKPKKWSNKAGTILEKMKKTQGI